MGAVYEVELVVFSGRPNPHFTLAGAGARRLEQMVTTALRNVRGLPTGAAPALGYQGLMVHARMPDGQWRPWLRVGADEITVMWGPQAATYDDGSAIEAWLLRQADRAGLREVVKSVVPPKRRGGQGE